MISLLFIGPPGEPAGIKASNAGTHSVVVSWSRGAENGGSISSYIIEKFNVDTKKWIHAMNGTCYNHFSVRCFIVQIACDID